MTLWTNRLATDPIWENNSQFLSCIFDACQLALHVPFGDKNECRLVRRACLHSTIVYHYMWWSVGKHDSCQSVSQRDRLRLYPKGWPHRSHPRDQCVYSLSWSECGQSITGYKRSNTRLRDLRNTYSLPKPWWILHTARDSCCGYILHKDRLIGECY